MMHTLKMIALAAGISATMTVGAMATPIVTATELSVSDLNLLTPMANPTATTTTGAVQQNVVGSVPGVRRSPWEGSTHEATGRYTSVSGGGSATYVFSMLQNGLSLIWGSPDDYNNLYLELISGNSIVATYNGVAAQPPVRIGASLFTVTGVLFDRVRFTSGANAFEFANLKTSPIPLPAAAWMLLAALGSLLVIRRRRQAAA